jgi:dGTPase
MKKLFEDPRLQDLLLTLDQEEDARLSPVATRSSSAKRKREEDLVPYRQGFAVDADRILHSRAYSRYIDKTQVFSLESNDHITHRLLHVQLVSRIARTIGRYLSLNEDLIEAIALGHDIGHPPFGHDGESYLSEICLEHGLPAFQHNLQSVRFLDRLERKGEGWNLSLQVLDGILCHDGETHAVPLQPASLKDFAAFDTKLSAKEEEPTIDLIPATYEACVVRLADTIAYIGRDLEDAIVLGLIKRSELPPACVAVLGDTNGTIVYRLVTDLILTSSRLRHDSCPLGFSEEFASALKELKTFNYERIYFATQTKRHAAVVRDCYRQLFAHYLASLLSPKAPLPPGVDLMADINKGEGTAYLAEERVRDYISGMTDSYFIRQARSIGCHTPDLP